MRVYPRRKGAQWVRLEHATTQRGSDCEIGIDEFNITHILQLLILVMYILIVIVICKLYDVCKYIDAFYPTSVLQ